MSTPETQSKPPLQWIKSPEGVLDFYANSIHPTWTLDDVRLRFGQMVASPDSPHPSAYKAAVEERVGITLSWRMAKVLRDGLTRAIDSYEKVNGPIQVETKLPPSF